MADMIARLKVDSAEYDAKIKRAAQGLMNMAQSAKDTGRILNVLEDENRDYIKSLGNMATVAKTASGKLAELTAAFTDIKSVYNSLSQEEKQGEFGRELNKQLEIMKGRINASRDELKGIKDELNGTGGFMDALTSKLTVNIDAMKLFEVGLKAGSAALEVVKDAFFASEATVDEWGRTIASAQSVYEGFLTALNTGDISGYLNNIDQIVQAAREAYNELDTLQTMQTIQAPVKSGKETEINRMRMMLMTGKYIAPAVGGSDAMFNGRRMQTGETLTQDQLRQIEKQIQNATKDIVTIIEREVKQAGKHIDAYYNKLAKENGMSIEEFRKGTSNWEEFTKRIKGAKDYRKFESEHTTVRQTYNAQIGDYETTSFRDNTPNPYSRYKGWDVFRVDKMGENSYNDLVGYIKQRDQQASQLYSTIGQTYRTINRLEGITPRNLLKGNGVGGGNGSGNTAKELTPLQEVQKQITDLSNEALTADKERQDAIKEQIALLQKEAEEYKKIHDYVQGKGTASELFPDVDIPKGDSLTTFERLQDSIRTKLSDKAAIVDENTMITTLTVAIQNGIDSLNPDFSELQERMGEGMDITDSAWEALVEKINEKLAELNIDPIKIDFETGNLINPDSIKTINDELKISVKQAQLAGNAFSQLGSAISQIEDPAAKATGLIMQAIGNTAAAFGSAQLQAAQQGGPWAWIAFAITGLATMITTIQGIKSATKGGFAEGGIVPGNSWSGDNLRTSDYGINSGELILSRSQQDVLAAQLETPEYYSGGNSTISGEQIVTVVNAYGRRTGRGEILT